MDIHDPEAIEKFSSVEEEVQKCNCIKYAAYRTATKLRVLQKRLGFDNVSINLVKGVLQCRRILLTDSGVLVTKDEMEDILHDIFYAASKRSPENLNVSLLVKMVIVFFRKVYKFHGDSINSLDLKVGITCLCSTSLQNKYVYWFSQLADHNLRLSRKRLHTLLQSLLAITHYLAESNTFSFSLIDASLDSCFTKDNAMHGMNENDFICWVLQEPQLLVWLSTLYRMQNSERVVHHVQCAVCGISPITGLRYHCLRCLGYDMCQTCFFMARRSKNHKPNHMIREYCARTSSYEMAVAYVKGFLRRICGNPTKLQYLPARPQNMEEGKGDEIPLINNKDDRPVSPEVTNICSGKADNQLQDIINQIEKQANMLNNVLAKETPDNIIARHVHFLKDHLTHLRELKHELERDSRLCYMSTPISENFFSRGPRVDEFEMSPVVVKASSNWDVPSPSGFSTWLENASTSDGKNDELQKQLDQVMVKLNNLLDFSVSEE